MVDFDDRLQNIGSSIKASWRARQLEAACDDVKVVLFGVFGPRKAKEIMENLAQSFDDFGAAIHEFSSETDTKVIERALREGAEAARQWDAQWIEEALAEVVAEWVSH